MQQRIERLFCLMKRRYVLSRAPPMGIVFFRNFSSFRTLPDYVALKEPWNTDNFKRFHLGTFPWHDHSLQ